MNVGGFKRQIVVLLLLFSSASLWSGTALALDPKKAITQYVHDVWQIEDGLPQNSVAPIQTRDGYIWLATEEGLVRFDGVRFTVFDTENTNEIKNNVIYDLLEDRQGSLWIATGGGGLTRLKDGRFTHYGTEDGLAHDFIMKIYEDREGSLWIAAEVGLTRFKDREFTVFTTKDGLAHDLATSFYEDREGSLWIGTRDGLNRFKDGQFTVYTTDDGLSNNSVGPIHEDREGALWIGTAGGGLNRFKDGKFTTYTTDNGLLDDFVWLIHEDRGGTLWIGTRRGLNRLKDGIFTSYSVGKSLTTNFFWRLYEDREGTFWIGTNGGGLNRFENGQFTAYTTKQGLSSDVVNSIYEDREGSLWVGTNGGGLNRFRDGAFTTYSTVEGLSHDFAKSIYEDREGDLWIGTRGGLDRFRDGKFTSYTAENGLSNNMVMSVYGDRKGNLWIGTFGGGLNRFKDGKFTIYTTKQGMSNNMVNVIYEDREGTLWIGTRDGLNRFKDGTFTTYRVDDGLSYRDVRAIIEDREGSLWVGTYGGGLNRFRDGVFTSYTAGQGLSNNMVWTIYEDWEGSLWIGTGGGGLNRFKDGRFTIYTTHDGLIDDTLYQILEDGNDNLWMTCNKGILRVSKKELNDFAEGKIASVTSVIYGTADGMRTDECVGGAQPAGWKTRDGRLWFPTIKGVVVVDPDNMKLNTLPPPVVIEQVRVDQNSIDPRQRVELSPGKGEIEIHYTALSFLDPKKVYFKYKLDGYNHDWVDAGTRRVAYYTNILPGAYRFHVIACNNDGMWNETGAAIEFRLQPHFYQTKWFYGLCALAVVIMGIGVHHLRVRELRSRHKELTMLVGMRTRELEELNQDLEQRVSKEIKARTQAERLAAYGKMVATVAHEVRNPLFALQTASYVIEDMIAEDEEAKEQLEVIQRETERLTSLMNDLLEFARPTPLQLGRTQVGELLKEAVATCQAEHDVTFPQIVLLPMPDLPSMAVDRSRLVQVLVNLIENAAKHAQRITTVTLSAEWVTQTDEASPQICIRVANDGAGIAAEDLPKIFDPFFTTGQGTGLGLAIVQQIIRGHGGTITVESQPEAGTVFTISLPTEHAEKGE